MMTPAQKQNANRAYAMGKSAALRGLPIESNPYKTRRVIGLANWWEKGWREAKDE